MAIKTSIDWDECEGNGVCARVAPEIYSVDAEGNSDVLVDEVPEPASEGDARHAPVPDECDKRLGGGDHLVQAQDDAVTRPQQIEAPLGGYPPPNDSQQPTFAGGDKPGLRDAHPVYWPIVTTDLPRD